MHCILVFILLLLSSCSAKATKIVLDAIEEEIKVAEKIIEEIEE
jgi:hypothetical protein